MSLVFPSHLDLRIEGLSQEENSELLSLMNFLSEIPVKEFQSIALNQFFSAMRVIIPFDFEMLQILKFIVAREIKVIFKPLWNMQQHSKGYYEGLTIRNSDGSKVLDSITLSVIMGKLTEMSIDDLVRQVLHPVMRHEIRHVIQAHNNYERGIWSIVSQEEGTTRYFSGVCDKPGQLTCSEFVASLQQKITDFRSAIEAVILGSPTETQRNIVDGCTQATRNNPSTPFVDLLTLDELNMYVKGGMIIQQTSGEYALASGPFFVNKGQAHFIITDVLDTGNGVYVVNKMFPSDSGVYPVFIPVLMQPQGAYFLPQPIPLRISEHFDPAVIKAYITNMTCNAYGPENAGHCVMQINYTAPKKEYFSCVESIAFLQKCQSYLSEEYPGNTLVTASEMDAYFVQERLQREFGGISQNAFICSGEHCSGKPDLNPRLFFNIRGAGNSSSYDRSQNQLEDHSQHPINESLRSLVLGNSIVFSGSFISSFLSRIIALKFNGDRATDFNAAVIFISSYLLSLNPVVPITLLIANDVIPNCSFLPNRLRGSIGAISFGMHLMNFYNKSEEVLQFATGLLSSLSGAVFGEWSALKVGRFFSWGSENNAQVTDESKPTNFKPN